MIKVFKNKINLRDINKKILIYGWIDSKREFKKIIFINVRSNNKIIQTCFNYKNKKLYKKILKINKESCVKILGVIKHRPKNKINNKIINGKIEIHAKKIILLNKSVPLPIDVKTNNICNKKISEYRYLYLRKKNIYNNIKKRSKLLFIIHKFMNKNKFIEIETPILNNTTDEGARNYIIPSRIHKKKFFSLQQSPQLFKQLLMIAGFNKYYQIARCFRDEDLRSNRQPEFTQLDMEMSFSNFKKLKKIIENLIKLIWLKINNIKIKKFYKLKYKECIKRYGTDKPDLRNPIKIIKIDNLINKTKIFNKKKYLIYILYAPCKKKIKKKKIIEIYNNKIINKKKILIFEFNKNKFNLLIKKKKIINNFLNITNVIKKIKKKIKLKNNNLFLVVKIKKNNILLLNKFINIIGKKTNIIKKKKIIPLWVTNIPIFTKNKKGNLKPKHHIFTLPKTKIKNVNPIKIIGESYDLIINGNEIGSGSIRINDYNKQKKILKIYKKKKEIKKKYKTLLNALEFGAPPHLGIALGIDRIMMLLTKDKDIKNVIAFPKTTGCIDYMTKSPDYLNKNILKKYE